MSEKTIVHHEKGQKHSGKTDWSRVVGDQSRPTPDSENPELVGKKKFEKSRNT